MSKNVISHPKFAKVVDGKTPHFNTKDTYLVMYVHTSVLSIEMVEKAFADAINELSDNYPDRRDEFKETVIRVCMPTKYNADTGTQCFQDYSNVFVSNYEVGQAICGFNFNTSMRKRIVCSDNDDAIDLGKEIEERFPEYEPLNSEERRACTDKYKSVINKITEAKRDTFILNIKNCIDHPDKMDILLDIVFKAAQRDNFETKNFIYMFMQLSVAEVIKVEDLSDSDDEDSEIKPERFVVSIFHVKLVEHIRSLMADVIEKKVTRPELMNTAKFIGELFAERAVDLPLFTDIYRFLMSELFDTDDASVEDSDMMIMIGILKSSCIRIKQHEPKLIEELSEIIDDFGEIKHKMLMKDVYDIIDKAEHNNDKLGEVIGKGSISAKFRFENLNALCTLPAVAIPPSYTDLVRKHVEEEKMTECKNLQYCGISAHTLFVLRPTEVKKYWEIISSTVPKWVENSMLRREFGLYNTSPDESYPIVTSREVSDNCKSVTIEFSQEAQHFKDALFALKMLGRMKLKNSEHNEHVVLSFCHRESFEKKGGKGGKGGKGAKR